MCLATIEGRNPAVEPRGSRLAAPRPGCRALGLWAADIRAPSRCHLGLHHLGGRPRVSGDRTTTFAWFWSCDSPLRAESWTGQSGVATQLQLRCLGAQQLLGPPSLVLLGLVTKLTLLTVCAYLGVIIVRGGQPKAGPGPVWTCGKVKFLKFAQKGG